MLKANSVNLKGRASKWVLVEEASGAKSNDNPGETPSAEALEPLERHPKFFFDNTLVAIQVERTLFNVHKYQLAKSEVFSDMFKIPRPKGNEPEEGSSPEHPIVLNGVTATDFAALLTVLYASHFSSDQPAPEASLVIPAFRLANMFNFAGLREFLLPLAEENLGDVDKIVFAREFDIKEWLVPAHSHLCQREKRLDNEEARKLGVDSVLIISHMREQHRPQNRASSNTIGLIYYKTSNVDDSESPERHPEFFFDNTLVAIQFNVHKYQLAKSEVFSDMFNMPKPEDDEPEEGSSPEHPIRLEGVSASDFAALLRVLYASHFSSNQPTPEASLVIPAFRLANMFNFSELCAFLLPLAEENLNDVDKIVFAREFDINEWLAPAHIRLCQREAPLSGEEARKLGLESVLIISRMREQHRQSPASPFMVDCHYCCSCAGMEYESHFPGTYDCGRCGAGRPYTMRYTGTDTRAPSNTAPIDNAAIEAGVKKWVEDGYAMKD